MTQHVIIGPPPRAPIQITPAQVPDHVLNEMVKRANGGINPESAAIVYAGDIAVLVGEIVLLRKDIGQALGVLRRLPVAQDASLTDTAGQVVAFLEPQTQAFWQQQETQRLQARVADLEQTLKSEGAAYQARLKAARKALDG